MLDQELSLLTELIRSQSRVILPQVGAFLVKDLEGGFRSENVSFSPYLRFNDGGLSGYFAERLGLDGGEAERRAEALSAYVSGELEAGRGVSIPGLGELNPGAVVSFSPVTGVVGEPVVFSVDTFGGEGVQASAGAGVDFISSDGALDSTFGSVGVLGGAASSLSQSAGVGASEGDPVVSTWAAPLSEATLSARAGEGAVSAESGSGMEGEGSVQAVATGGKPAEGKPVGGKSVQRKTAQGRPVQRKPVQGRPVQRRPVQRKPVQRKAVESKPVQSTGSSSGKGGRVWLIVLVVLLVLGGGVVGMYFFYPAPLKAGLELVGLGGWMDEDGEVATALEDRDGFVEGGASVAGVVGEEGEKSDLEREFESRVAESVSSAEAAGLAMSRAGVAGGGEVTGQQGTSGGAGAASGAPAGAYEGHDRSAAVERTPVPYGGEHGYHIILGSFRNPEYASDYAARLRDRGYEASILDRPSGMQAVSVGTYGSNSEAQSALYDLQSEFPEAWILYR